MLICRLLINIDDLAISLEDRVRHLLQMYQLWSTLEGWGLPVGLLTKITSRLFDR